MSYTTVELVKRQTLISSTIDSSPETVSITLSGTDWVQITNSAVKSGSVSVRALLQASPASQQVTFVTDIITLSTAPLVENSLILASDSSLGLVYSEGADFLIDHESGALTRLNSGVIPAVAKVHLWYFPYTKYSENVDFAVESETGRVRRLSGGAIPAGLVANVRFTPKPGGFSQEVFNEAVSEANQRVSAAVDPETEFGANLALQTAATYLAAAILCRVAATAALAEISSGKNAALWLETARSFQNDANDLIANFKPPRATLSGPQRA